MVIYSPKFACTIQNSKYCNVNSNLFDEEEHISAEEAYNEEVNNVNMRNLSPEL